MQINLYDNFIYISELDGYKISYIYYTPEDKEVSIIIKHGRVWYYNKIAYGVGEWKIDKSKTATEILKKDLIIIIQTEAYYHDLGMGFIECAYEQLKNKQ